MQCRICGTPINAGEKFCSLCGEKVETFEEIQQSQAQQAYGRQPDKRQSYERQPDSRRQSYTGQPYEQQSYGQQYGSHSSGNMYYSVSGRSRKGLWITLSLVVVLAAAAVLMFTVFGDKQAVSQATPPPQKTLPFKGDTIQTKFANDTAKVVYDALDIFGDVGIDTNELAEQPFDMKLDMTMKAMKNKADMRMDMAYDNETLGMNINAEGNTIKMALIDDVLYMDILGSVTGLDLNSSADLSKPMTFQDRMNAFAEGLNLPQNTTNADGYTGLLLQSLLSKSDYTALAELYLNSIDEKCFKSSGSSIVFTFNYDEEIASLRRFAGKLETNEELKKMYEDFVRENTGIITDAIKQINDSVDVLEEKKKTDDYELVCELSYENEKPVSFKIKPDEEYELSFGYQQNEDSIDISFEIVAGSSSRTISGECNLKKAGSGTDIEGSIIAQGKIMTFYGNIDFSGNNTHGTITMNVPDTYSTTNVQGAEVSIDFNLTVNIGMPDIKVKDDERFNVDTSGASIIDASSMLGGYGLPGI